MITSGKKERIFSLFLLLVFFLKISDNMIAQVDRVISVSPGVTASLIYFGYGDKIVGVTSYDYSAEELKAVENIGGMFSPNIEKIVYLKPDYVIFQSHYDDRLVSQLEKIGIKTLKLESPTNIEEIILSLEDIISIFSDDSTKDTANLRLENLKSKIERSRERASQIKKRPKIFYFLGLGHHIYTAGRETFIDDIITTAGGMNIVEEKGWSYPLEALIIEDPDFILTSSQNWEAIKKDSRFGKLSAVKNDSVILIDERLITLPTPESLTDGLEIIQKAVLEFNLSD